MNKLLLPLLLISACAAEPAPQVVAGKFHPAVHPGIVGGVSPRGRAQDPRLPNLDSVDECTDPSCPGCAGSPIIVDVAGDGYDLTDAEAGVAFDIEAAEELVQIAWTKEGSDDAFLALDLDGDGAITNGGELFGNFTPQPGHDDRNGYAALAVYDLNGDGLIDARDAIFYRLLLWTDSNHDGISQAEELRPVAGSGIEAFHLDYGSSSDRDASGNFFQYWSEIDVSEGSAIASPTFDVFLLSAGAYVQEKATARERILHPNGTCLPALFNRYYGCRSDCYQTSINLSNPQSMLVCGGTYSPYDPSLNISVFGFPQSPWNYSTWGLFGVATTSRQGATLAQINAWLSSTATESAQMPIAEAACYATQRIYEDTNWCQPTNVFGNANIMLYGFYGDHAGQCVLSQFSRTDVLNQLQAQAMVWAISN